MHEAILGVGWIAGGGVNNVWAEALHGATAAVNVDIERPCHIIASLDLGSLQACCALTVWFLLRPSLNLIPPINLATWAHTYPPLRYIWRSTIRHINISRPPHDIAKHQ